VSRHDTGHSVFTSEIPDVLPHLLYRDAIDDAGNYRVKAQGSQEPTDVVDRWLRDGQVRDGLRRNGRGLPEARKERGERMRSALTWNDNNPGVAIVIEE
jgi:hypothetical protein